MRLAMAEPQISASRVVCRCPEWPQAVSGALKSAATLTNRSGDGASSCARWATSSKQAHDDLRPSWGSGDESPRRTKSNYARSPRLSSEPIAGHEKCPIGPFIGRGTDPMPSRVSRRSSKESSRSWIRIDRARTFHHAVRGTTSDEHVRSLLLLDPVFQKFAHRSRSIPVWSADSTEPTRTRPCRHSFIGQAGAPSIPPTSSGRR